jgi:hypothetical protein
MCEFEDKVIHTYTKKQAIDDGLMVQVMHHNNKPVVATASVYSEVNSAILISVWKEFLHWDKYIKPSLPEEDQLFYTGINGKRVWVMEDGEAFTIMYPEDY